MVQIKRSPHLPRPALLFGALLLVPWLARAQTPEEGPSEPASEPTSAPTSEPVSAPASEPTNEPASEPASEPVSIPVLEPASEPTSIPASAPALPPTALPTPEEPALPKVVRPLAFLLEQPSNPLFSFASGPVEVSFFVQLQAQIAIYVGKETVLEEDSPAIAKGYRVRRARAGLWGDFSDEFDYVLTLDLRDETLPGDADTEDRPLGARLLDAAISWKRYPFAVITVGANKTPFSRGASASSFTTTFQEAPFTVSRLAPGRRAGISTSGSFERFSYMIGQYNTSRSLSFGGPPGGLLSLGRVEITPLGPLDPDQSAARTFDGARFGLGTGGSVAVDKAQNTITFSANADLLLQAGPVTALAEATFSQTEPRRATQPPPQDPPETVRRFGAYGQLGLMLFPERLEVALRGEIFDGNMEVRDAGDILAFTAGATLISYGNRIRTTLNFTRRLELAGDELANDHLLLQVGARF